MGKASLTIAIGGEYQGRDAIRKAEADLKSMREAARQAGGGASDIMSIGDAAVDVGSMLEVSGQKLEAYGTKLTKLTAPIAAIGAASVKLAADYQDSVAKVYTIMDKGTMSTEQMSKSILDLSTATGKSADELADATYQALSASVSTEKAAGFVADAVKLSKVGFTDTATAVDTLTTVINAYGYSADDAAMITGRLVQTQNKGKTTVNELASSMGNAIPTASAYNVSLDNLCSAYVIMTKQGINTAEATTAINGMLTELAKEGSNVAKVLRERTGKSFGQLMADGMDLGQVLQILNESVDGDSEAFANLWGNVRASKGAVAIANAGAEEFTAAMGDMADSAGLVDEALDDLATPAAKARKALNAVKNTGIELGEEIIGAAVPSLDKLAGMAQDLYKWFGNLDDSTKQNIVRFGALAVAAGPVMTLFGKGMQVVGGFVTSIGKGLQTVGSFTAAMKAAETEMKAAGATTVSMGAKMKAAAESTGVMTRATTLLRTALATIGIAAVIALVGIIVDKYNQWKEHTELVSKATQDLSSVLGSTEASASSFVSSIDSSSSALEGVESAARKCLQAQADLNDETRTTFTEMATAAAKVDYYADIIGELADKEGLTAEEQFKLADAVDNFNNLTGNSIEVFDSQNGRLSTTRDNVLQLADAWRQEAEAKALEEVYSKYVQQAIEDSIRYDDVMQKLADTSEGFGLWIGDFPVIADEASVAYHDLQVEARDLEAAERSANANAEEVMRRRLQMSQSFSTLEDAMHACGLEMADLGTLTDAQLAEMEANFDGTLSSIADTCVSQGHNIPAGLAKGVAAEKSTATDAIGDVVQGMIDEARNKLKSHSPSMVMHQLGADMDAGLANGLKSAQSQPLGTISDIVAQIKARTSGLPSDFQSIGSRSGQGLASSIASGASSVASSASHLASTALAGISPSPSAFASTGSSAGSSFASAVGSTSAYWAGSNLAQTARSGLNSVGAWDLGCNLGNSFANGMLGSSVWNAAYSLAVQARNAIAYALSIGSPSKVGIELGGFFGEGVAIGIDESAGLVGGASRGLADTIEMAMTPNGTFAPMLAQAAAPRGGDSSVVMNVTVNVNASTAAEGRAVGTGLAEALYEEISRKEGARLWDASYSAI